MTLFRGGSADQRLWSWSLGNVSRALPGAVSGAHQLTIDGLRSLHVSAGRSAQDPLLQLCAAPHSGRKGLDTRTVRDLECAAQTPLLRLAAWRAVWGALKANPVYAVRYWHLTTRERNKLKPTQAQTVMGAAVLRQLHAVITTGRAWDPDIAVHGTRHRKQPPIAA